MTNLNISGFENSGFNGIYIYQGIVNEYPYYSKDDTFFIIYYATLMPINNSGAYYLIEKFSISNYSVPIFVYKYLKRTNNILDTTPWVSTSASYSGETGTGTIDPMSSSSSSSSSYIENWSSSSNSSSNSDSSSSLSSISSNSAPVINSDSSSSSMDNFLYYGGEHVLTGEEFSVTGSTVTYDYVNNTAKLDNPESATYIDCREIDDPLDGNINVSGCSSLDTLYCFDNNLKSINVNGCTALRIFQCDNNSITSLDLSTCSSLYDLGCYTNPLSYLNISGCTSLVYLDADETELTSIDLPNCPLSQFYCCDTLITQVDISGKSELYIFECSNSPITSINFSGCNNLAYAYCDGCSLTTIDVSGLTNLIEFKCNNNLLNNINISGCSIINEFRANDNLLLTEEIDTILSDLVNTGATDGKAYLDGTGNEEPSEEGYGYVDILRANGWEVFINDTISSSSSSSSESSEGIYFEWEPLAGSGSEGRSWLYNASSIDGNNVAAIGYKYDVPDIPDVIYVTNNGGETWSQSASDIHIVESNSIVCSGDFQYIYTFQPSTNTMFLSNNGGVSWSNGYTFPIEFGNITSLSCSRDGSKIIGVKRNFIYFSNNYGVDWTQSSEVAGGNDILGIISGDGNTIIIADKDGGYCYTSKDDGVTWSEKTNTGSLSWGAVCCSYDGQTIYIADTKSGDQEEQITGYVQKSIDEGETWEIKESSGSHVFDYLSCSDDGQTIFAFQDAEASILTSINGGNTWSDQSSFGLENGFYYEGSGSNTGSVFYVYNDGEDTDHLIWKGTKKYY